MEWRAESGKMFHVKHGTGERECQSTQNGEVKREDVSRET